VRARFEYFRPDSLLSALQFLDAHGDQTSLLAGGTDLMIAARNGELKSRFVLDISRLDELNHIERVDGLCAVGAGVTFTEISNSPEIFKSAPLLARAARTVGSPQIRNLGTIGGNVANASPAADGVPPLVVLRTRAHIRSFSSERTVFVEELITAPYRTSLKPDELIVRFLIEPIPSGCRWSFQRIARRKSLAIARVNAAVLASLDSQGVVEDLRLCVGSILPQPARMTTAEETLKGKIPSPELIRLASETVSSEMIRRSGIRPTTEYKKPAVEGLVIKALSETLLETKHHA
jgi:CO/xanthine dehydrogenase FAD-binding subunit